MRSKGWRKSIRWKQRSRRGIRKKKVEKLEIGGRGEEEEQVEEERKVKTKRGGGGRESCGEIGGLEGGGRGEGEDKERGGGLEDG